MGETRADGSRRDERDGRDGCDAPAARHCRPDGVDDATVEALGKLSEAFEVAEDARGRLYGFHRLTGKAHVKLAQAVELLEKAGHTQLAADLRTELLGRNVVEGRWTFQLVEEYDDGYFADWRRFEARAREELAGGRRHLYEAEMKEDWRTHGRRHHEAVPPEESEPAEGPGPGAPADAR